MAARYDCVAILTDHRAFDYEMLTASADLIVDTRNAIRNPQPHVFRLGSPRPDASPAEAERAGLAVA
jgi:UDP-N-acetyl-D-mannosaminuronate dehydrogenase